MRKEEICLNDLQPGQSALVTRLEAQESIRRRLLDIGLIENTRVECRMKGPGGDPAAYWIRGAVIAIRRKDGKDIFIRKQEKVEELAKVQEKEGFVKRKQEEGFIKVQG